MPPAPGGAGASAVADAGATAADGAAPVAAVLAQPAASALFPIFHAVRCGCWLVNYTPTGSGLVTFDGTIRVECHEAGRTASGDLYQRPFGFAGKPPRPILAAPPNPAAGIPIFAIGRYRYYVRVTQLLETFSIAGSFPLGFELHRFDATSGAWTNEGAFTAQMTWMAAPGGYPSPGQYLEGDVRSAPGAVVGRLKMGWVSPRLRKVVVEIDTVAGSERPVDNGAGLGWAQIFDAVNWDATIHLGDTNVTKPASGDTWSDAEMHAGMLAWRETVSLDKEWHYHILAVPHIASTPRGVMYDVDGTDSDKVPREGVGISTHWIIPKTSDWGLVQGQRFGTAAAPFFRTAVHELGHAFGLYHNIVDNGFMNTTDVISASATAANPFPNNIKWAYATDDLKRLRHYPDIFVRPGGTSFGTASSTTPAIAPTDLQAEMPGLELAVKPLEGEVPLGAPVRVSIALRNTGEVPQRVPERLSLKTDFVRGWVTDSSGSVKSFSPVIRCIEDKPMRDLAPGEELTADFTLLRGGEGALFPAGGLYEVTVEVSWEVGEAEAAVRGAATVLVTGAQSGSHAAAAHTVLATPDAHLVLVLGGDHLDEGMAAIRKALGDEVLRPYYAVIEAKRLAGLPEGKSGDERQEIEKLVDVAVMTPTEKSKICTFLEDTEPPPSKTPPAASKSG
ncbi:MAG: hypothetical protein JO013_13705 [Alphaproteobacteria bacterium]|nr:hypothetical protein [Alphaproteobacteria bacterium]